MAAFSEDLIERNENVLELSKAECIRYEILKYDHSHFILAYTKNGYRSCTVSIDTFIELVKSPNSEVYFNEGNDSIYGAITQLNFNYVDEEGEHHFIVENGEIYEETIEISDSTSPTFIIVGIFIVILILAIG